MGTRTNAPLGEDVVLGLRHFYNGYLADAFQINSVTVSNPRLQSMYTVPGTQVQRLGLGIYTITIPGSIFNEIGEWWDTWDLQATETSGNRRLRFGINVINLVQPAEQVDIMQALRSYTLEDLDACFLKRNYLFPVREILDAGYHLPDSVLQHHIDVAITEMQRQLGLPLRQMRVLTYPYAADQTPPNPIKGTDYDEDGTLLQFSAIESVEWANVRLPHSGIIRVNGLRGVYNGQVVYHIPLSWIIRNEFKNGFVRIRPTTAGAVNTLIDQSGQFLETTLLEARGMSTVPGFWAADYTYGQENHQLEAEIVDVIMKKASVQLLDQIGMMITRGLSGRSAQVDGLGTTTNFVANSERSLFGALCKRYEESLAPENLIDLKRRYKGPVVFFI